MADSEFTLNFDPSFDLGFGSMVEPGFDLGFDSDFGDFGDFWDFWDLSMSPVSAGLDFGSIAEASPSLVPTEFFNFELTPDFGAEANPTLADNPATWPDQLKFDWFSGQTSGAEASQLAAQIPQFQQDLEAGKAAGNENLRAAGLDPDKIGFSMDGKSYTLGLDGQWQELDLNAPAPDSAQPAGWVSTAEILRDPNNPGLIAAAQTQVPMSWGQVIKSAFDGVNTVLNSPAGRTLAGLGVAGATLGLSSLLTGDVQKIPQPAGSAAAAANAAIAAQAIGSGQQALISAYQQGGQADLTAAFRGGMAGERSLADLLRLQAAQEYTAQQTEQPGTTPIRQAAIGQIPGQMNATTNPNIVGTGQLGQAATGVASGLIPGAGTIGQGIGQQIQNVLSGQYSNPILENNIKRRREEFEARMYAQLGPGWQTSTPGMQAQEQQDLLEESLRFQDQQQTIANYTPLYSSIIGQQANIGQAATGQTQAAQAQGLQQNVALSQFGRTAPGSLATNLGTITPPTSLAALPAAATTVNQIGSQSFTAEQLNAAAANRADQSLASGIGSLGGAIAGGLMRNSIAAGS